MSEVGQDDPSNGSPIAWDRGDPSRRCKAHKKTGEQCRRWAIRGGTVCTHHGGKAPLVRAKARQRIEEALDRNAKLLLGIAESAESEAVKLAAVKHVLAIGGLSEKTALDVEVTVKPWETLIAGMTGETRAESRARRGMAELPAAQYWDRNSAEVIDVETVPDTATVPPHFAAGDFSRANRGTGPDTPAQPANSQTPGTELMTLEEANELLAQQRGQGTRRRP